MDYDGTGKWGWAMKSRTDKPMNFKIFSTIACHEINMASIFK